MRVKHLFSGMLAVLAVLLLTGCGEKDNPVRTSLDVDTSTLTLSVGESAVRMAFSKAEDAAITYTSSKPAVATVDQFGKVTAMSEGSATITIDMAETKKSWYAAKTITYEVVVKNVSAKAVANVDKATPLTLVAQADGKITVTFNNGITLANDIKYTINNGAEQTIAKNTTGAYDIEVKKGDVVQFYSLNTSLGGGSTVAGVRGTTRAVDDGAKYINIRPSMKTEIYGNVMSLLKGNDNLESATALEAKNAFYGLFAGAEKLVNNTERLLVLPATTLTEGCYQDMFNGCKGIEKAPELPAPKLEKNCYQEMFYDCAKLNHVKCLATDIKAENSTKDWLGKAGTEATESKVLESVVPMTPNSDDGVPTSWTAQKIVAVESVTLGKTELALVVNQADVTLTATVKPDDASDKTVTWTSDKPEVATVDANGTVHAVAAGTATITAQAGDKTATCVVTVTDAPTAIDLSKLTAAYEAQNGDVLTGMLNGSTQPYKISIAKGATVTLDGVTINGKNNESYNWAGITCMGDATIILKDGSTNTVTGFYGFYPGIQAAVDHTLTIKGTGSLEASSNGVGAGIGGGCGIACGNIKIEGGTITATGGDGSAGIGSGERSSCGNIKIEGGTVTATGGQNAAGIGSGIAATCGNILIQGGTVEATGKDGGAGIGSGGDYYGNGADCGTVTITTGVIKVTATKGSNAPNSIGKGQGESTCGTVTIGGNVGAKTASPYVYPTPALSLTSPTVGQVIGSDGKNYAANATLPTGVTKVAMIAYVSGSNGLAIALADESGYMNWATAKSTCEAKTPAFTGGTWKLPSLNEWKNMLTYDEESEMYKKNNLKTALSTADGTSLREWSNYWSSTDYVSDNTQACYVKFQGDEADLSNESKNSSSNMVVRAVLAF